MIKKLILLFSVFCICITNCLSSIVYVNASDDNIPLEITNNQETENTEEINEKELESEDITELEEPKESDVQSPVVSTKDELELPSESSPIKDIPTEENLANAPPVLAQEEINRAIVSGTLDWTSIDPTYRVNVAGTSLTEPEGVWFTLNGETVFCIEAKVQAYKGQDYEIDTSSLTDAQRHEISLITYFGFTTQPKDQIHYMSTQIMIFWVK